MYEAVEVMVKSKSLKEGMTFVLYLLYFIFKNLL